ncbi:Crp/Fnr family transcriptional regulator [Niabella ginsenosidivorans]|uniref:Crp/Fnr family transcriptional regulator n=1 Tax=Niabella ginsenosidivorans TaxID=1176587 RepID=A0A1A9I4T6_9BACT|nr:ThuA domain-containing protein [Niabella ginsenosidivorans]ANH82335.1 Crp/Fnr family transcriptional regulator [Niabella ginsenosidivorans]
MKRFLSLLLVISINIQGFHSDAQTVNWKKVKILVYTKNGKGYVHDNIPYAAAALQRLGIRYGFKVDTSADPAVMNERNLQQYTLLVFPSTNNDVFDTDEQRVAFRRYMEAGGGFVGLHSVTGTERNWRWFKMMLGGTFSWHAHFQRFTVRIIDPRHPSMQGLAPIWQKEDECYFEKELYPGPKVLMVHDLRTIDTTNAREKQVFLKNKGYYGDFYPAVWEQQFDGGHIWITTLGHDKKDYKDPVYLKHLIGGIRFIASRVKIIDFKKAYATHRDDAIRY